jgi:RimJ/RimL family protein N-acetyltransferase
VEVRVLSSAYRDRRSNIGLVSAAHELTLIGAVAGRPDRVTLRPLADGDAGELRRIHATPEVARWWDAPGERFPWDEPESTRLTILVDGAIAGLIQFHEEPEPKYRHAGIDLFLDPALHGRGLGTEAVRLLVGHLTRDRRHHRVVIDPATANAAAIRAYEKVGFKPVGVMRCAERDSDGKGWHDVLLMELLVDDL